MPLTVSTSYSHVCWDSCMPQVVLRNANIVTNKQGLHPVAGWQAGKGSASCFCHCKGTCPSSCMPAALVAGKLRPVTGRLASTAFWWSEVALNSGMPAGQHALGRCSGVRACTPVLPAISCSQLRCTPTPRGVTKPRPVTTTLRSGSAGGWPRRSSTMVKQAGALVLKDAEVTAGCFDTRSTSLQTARPSIQVNSCKPVRTVYPTAVASRGPV